MVLPASPSPDPAAPHASRALGLSTLSFTVCFAVWTIFSIIGVRLQAQLSLSNTELGLLLGTPILTGSLSRLLLGIWTDRFGGRLVYTLTMLAAAAATFLLSQAQSFEHVLLAALGVGIAGGSFAVGVAYVSRFYPAGRQGTALGIFGVGNVGAAVTKFLAPVVLVAWGWQAVAQIWALALLVMALVFWFFTEDDPVHAARRRGELPPPRSFAAEFTPLRDLRVWRFALYYFFAFGAFVALALWLPRYLIGAYGFDLVTAGMVAAAYSIPASIFRAYGGMLSDRIGARRVMYAMFTVAAVITLVLCLPPASPGQTPTGLAIGPGVFIALMFVLGFFMSLGKAAVYKHIPVYYPANVGAVGGLVGMIGGLGGFVLPLAFGALKDATGAWSSCFALLFLLIVVSLVWMHASIRQMHRARVGAGSMMTATVE